MFRSTTQNTKFSIKDFFSKCYEIRSFRSADFLTFTEEILNGKLHFLCSVNVGHLGASFKNLSRKENLRVKNFTFVETFFIKVFVQVKFSNFHQLLYELTA